MTDATWWDWKGSSRPFYWRWTRDRLGNTNYVKEIGDGTEVLYDSSHLPEYKKPQRPPKTQEDQVKVLKKLSKFIEGRFILFTLAAGVLSLISFFYVPKGESNIHMVFYGTSCMLNAATFAPWFALPTIDLHLHMVETGTWLANADLGNFFLFPP